MYKNMLRVHYKWLTTRYTVSVTYMVGFRFLPWSWNLYALNITVQDTEYGEVWSGEDRKIINFHMKYMHKEKIALEH